jgi:predicted membrane-bound spermidine synthase
VTPGRARARPAAALRLALVGAIFFLSGFPALVYQLVWQRSLFTIYGINIESVTVVVTGFMLGLGLGSLLGGVLSRLRPLPLLVMFAAIELGIGAFGINSLDLFAAVGAATIHSSPLVLKAAPLLLLLVPTLLMGATLPILVMHLVERSGNVGNAVGLLYFLNTLGSAVALRRHKMFGDSVATFRHEDPQGVGRVGRGAGRRDIPGSRFASRAI